MKKKRWLAVLAILMALCMMVSACSKKSEPKQESSATEESSAETKEEVKEESKEEAPAESSEEPEKEPVEESAEEPAEEVSEEEPVEETPLLEETELQNDLAGEFGKITAPVEETEETEFTELTFSTQLFGELSDQLEDYTPIELSEEQFAEMDRAMRAYSPGDETYIVNNAEEFYYYEHLTPEQQNIYDSIYLLAMDPGDVNHIVTLNTNQDPYSDEFAMDYWVALYAVGDDHPELWWVNPANGEHAVNVFIREANGKSSVMLQMKEVYPDFEDDVIAFNDAVEEFMADIDTSGSDEEVALAVHDKLIELATYDMDTMRNGGKGDLAHTAYGAFVANSAGTPNYCVCDGYSLAYEYILQQIGIPCAIVRGWVVVPYPDGDEGGHAWNIVMLDDTWYEFDSTWDDKTTFMDEVAEVYQPDTYEYQFFEEMTSDENYMSLVQHCKFELLSSEIEDYISPAYLTYTSKDGKIHFDPVGDSWRRRYCDYEETVDNVKGILTALLPVADGLPAGESSGRSEEETEEVEVNEEPAEAVDMGNSEILGTYYVAQFNDYDEEMLKAALGEYYYEELPMFELWDDETGVLIDQGETEEIFYIFDGEILLIVGENGSSLLLEYENGDFVINTQTGNRYVFSKM